MKLLKGVTYFRYNGFSINEGEFPNIHISWFRIHWWLFFYVAIRLFGKAVRISWRIPRKHKHKWESTRGVPFKQFYAIAVERKCACGAYIHRIEAGDVWQDGRHPASLGF